MRKTLSGGLWIVSFAKVTHPDRPLGSDEAFKMLQKARELINDRAAQPRQPSTDHRTRPTTPSASGAVSQGSSRIE